MRKFMTFVVVMVLILTVSVTSAGAYVLPQGTAISRKEGVSSDALAATEVFGFVGDADANNKVNVRDATDIQKHVAGLTELSQQGLKLADVDFSGSVNIKDATAIQKWVANFDTEAPVYHTLYSTDDEAGIEMFVGDWLAEVNLAKELNDVLSDKNSNGIKFSEVYTALHLTFGADGTYKMYISEESIDNTIVNFKAGYKEALSSYLEKFIKDNNLAITVGDMVKSSGYDSIDEMVEQIVDEDIVRNLLMDFNKEGRYEVDGITLKLSDTTDESVTPDKNAMYTFIDVNLVITGGNGLISGRLQPAVFVFIE